MGQYYLVVNKTKKQFLNPHAFHDGAKAWEIIANAGILKGLGYLLITSDEGGGGDLKENPLVGYRAGDEIIIVGDYDSSKLHEEAYTTYTDISSSVIAALLGESGGLHIFQKEIIKMLQSTIKERPPVPFDELTQIKRQRQPDPEPELTSILDDPEMLEIY